MKKLSLMFAFTALLATASFAGTNEEKELKLKSPIIEKKAGKELLKNASCTVTASWPNGNGGTNTVTITASCDSPSCTTQTACNQAYALVSIFVPGVS